MAIYHVTTQSEWQAARTVGVYQMSTKGATLAEVGFIHASTAEQLARTATFLYSGSDDELVVLELNDDEIRAAGIRIPWEDGGSGEKFPHIYGELRVPWVTATHPARFDAGGTFVWD